MGPAKNRRVNQGAFFRLQYGFVQMDEADKNIDQLNLHEVNGDGSA